MSGDWHIVGAYMWVVTIAANKSGGGDRRSPILLHLVV